VRLGQFPFFQGATFFLPCHLTPNYQNGFSRTFFQNPFRLCPAVISLITQKYIIGEITPTTLRNLFLEKPLDINHAKVRSGITQKCKALRKSTPGRCCAATQKRAS
jgi:hypothetical protein